ncbi:MULTISPECIES: GNAT family N-acetyltransferase [Herbaspirillum]|uniref:GNAT family N-acetyltransferase n=1 Tax=Herbaspirillum TaxID=963 RepID=UPI001F5285E5|nr:MULTISPECIES: GNAT family N-acetyltransferase [unclassified Herbaspirillum]MCI1016506.1 GNAT family N-acetyltransferase [Herbaspirillum sp. C7C2]HZG19074.1 GNAT family N-acetyltransferase [Herbaspirillum sp.]
MLHPIDRERQIIYCDRAIEVRPLGLREAPALFDAVRQSMQAISQWEAWCTPDYSLVDAKLFLQRAIEQWQVHAAYDFNIIDRTNGLVIGSVAVNQVSQLNQMANLGYWIREGYTGRGIAAVAARAAAAFAFAKTGLTRLEIVAQAGNLRSQRVAEKTGATLECLARNRLVFHGEPRDATVFSLVPSDLGRPVPVHT